MARQSERISKEIGYGASTEFNRLSFSKNRLYTVPMENTKTDETRQRYIEKAISELSKHES